MNMKKSSIIVLLLVLVTGVCFAITNLFDFQKEYLYRKSLQDKLAKEISEYVKNFPGEVGIYIKDLKTGIVVSYNADKLFASASLVKIPIMVSVYKAINDGIIKSDEKLIMKRKYRVRGCGNTKYSRSGHKFSVEELVKRMIDESDNTATNILSDRLGFNYINWSFKQFGLNKTNFDRSIMDLHARDYNGIENYTTAREMGTLLEKIYFNRLINEEISKKMLITLCQQKINDRIPKYLPKNFIIAHKTGLMRDVCHDAGIVFTEKTDFIICVLTSDFSSYKLAKRFIGNLAYTTFCVLL